MTRRRYSAGGGVPTTAGMYDTPPVMQYPFPSSSGGGAAGPSSNTTVNVNGQQADTQTGNNPFGAPASDEGDTTTTTAMRKGGKVKMKRARGDGIAQRGKTRGKFV